MCKFEKKFFGPIKDMGEIEMKSLSTTFENILRWKNILLQKQLKISNGHRNQI